MKIKKLASTVVLSTCLGTVCLFGMLFYTYLNVDSKTLTALKDSLSTTSGFFGGMATLAAAYVATKLFNDWKDQTRFEVNKEIVSNIIENSKRIYYSLNRFQVSLEHTKDMNQELIIDHHLKNIEFYQCTDHIYKLYEYVDTNCVLTSNTEIKIKLEELKFYFTNLESMMKNYWLHIYKPYYLKAVSENSDDETFKINIRQYTSFEKTEYKNHINKNINFFNEKHKVIKYNHENKLFITYITYAELSSKYESVYNEFIDLVVNQIKI